MTRTRGGGAWRRGVLTGIASVTVAVGMVFGSTGVAQADVLDDLAEQYAIGASGGQLSKLLKVSLKLRAMGYKPSQKYLDQLAAAMEYRPNQNPLIDALKNTIAYQAKIKAQMEVLQAAQSQQNASGAAMGAGQMPSDGNAGGMTAGGTQAGAVAPAAPAP